MDAEIAIATPMVNPLTSPLSDTVKPVVEQEQKGLLMQYPAETAQIGQQITQILITSPEPETLLARIAKALGEIFRVDACLIVAGVNPTTTNAIALWSADHYPTQPPRYQAQLLEHPTLKMTWRMYSHWQFPIFRHLTSPNPWTGSGKSYLPGRF
jgi:transcriptional regulator with GAF, ATPase, and Fis domain